MVRLKQHNASPLDYSLCNQVVTAYHRNGADDITRTVHQQAFLDFKKVRGVDKTGSKDAMSFLLVIPGEPSLEVGDKVMLGEGDEVTTDEQWRSFIPAKVPGLCVISYVDRKYWNAQVVHVEAGG